MNRISTTPTTFKHHSIVDKMTSIRKLVISSASVVFIALAAQAQNANLLLRMGTVANPGTTPPCNASIMASDFSSELYINNGEPANPPAVTFTIDPVNGNQFYLTAGAGAGYEFVRWEVTATDPMNTIAFLDGATPHLTSTWHQPIVTIIALQSALLRAVFRPIPPPTYTLEMVASPDAVAYSPAVGTHTNTQGAVVTLNVTPSSGKAFIRWEDPHVPGSPHPNVDIDTTYSPPRYRVTMTQNITVTPIFGEVFQVMMQDAVGPGTTPIYTNFPGGTHPTVRVPEPIIMQGLTERIRAFGWTDGGPQIPATGFAPNYTFSNPINTNNTIRWSWVREYQARVTTQGTGTGSIIGISDGNWYTNNAVLDLVAIPGAGSVFYSWSLGGVQIVEGSAGSPNIKVRVVNSPNISAAFNISTEPPEFVQWKVRMGLGAGIIPGVSGMYDDPDGDGLTNWTEFSITNNATGLTCDPLNADSDGDGMIDGWEHQMFGREYREDENIVPAPLDPGTGSEKGRYGPTGNPDEDYLWDTTTGWEMKAWPLNNWMEYCGPDGQPPWIIEEVTSQSLGLPAGKTVYRAVRNPLDSNPRDDSHPLEVDTDNDGFDDGFEYSWDQWQQANGDTLLANPYYWPGIVEDVESMIGAWSAGNRPFNPARPNLFWVSPEEATYGNSSNMDLDYWFDQRTGMIDFERPLTDLDEYLAYAISSATNLVYGTIPVRYPVLRPVRSGTTTRWCTNPFVWDSDGDGLPDGWEMTFGFDPWAIRSQNAGTPADRTDATWSSDNEAFAFDGTLRNYQVYLTYGFNPYTGIRRPDDPSLSKSPNTADFGNYQQLIGTTIDSMDDLPEMTLLNQNAWRSVHARLVDSDGDGMYDGWEAYVAGYLAPIPLDPDFVPPIPGMNPQNPVDAAYDGPNPFYDHDGLTNWEEFHSAATPPPLGLKAFVVDIEGRVSDDGSITNATVVSTDTGYFVKGWYNKRLPTDPWNLDTDGDQIKDGVERTLFNDPESTSIVNGGLNPTTVDTDGDFLPDGWEAYFGGSRWSAYPEQDRAPVNGTVSDAFEDPDGDRLPNYLEYMTGTIYHWQFQHVDADGNPITVFEPDVKPTGLYQYDPYDFLDPDVYGRQPHEWDPNYWAIKTPPAVRPVPYTYLGGANWNFHSAFDIPQYSTTDPGKRDSDDDMMDDYYEIFHGLNPVYGFNDLVRRKFAINGTVDSVLTAVNLLDEYDAPFVAQPPDLRRYPWMAGDPLLDPDQDQLLSIDEALLIDGPMPTAQNTDPSPLWMTDISSPHSWVNQFYWLGTTMGRYPYYWYWDSLTLLRADGAPAPSYMFDFEINDGFDTDNDGISDHAEVVHHESISPGVTSPIESQSPPRRRALYLDGNSSAARTPAAYAHALNDMRRFTVEIWARPANPQSGSRQTIVERSGLVPQGSSDLPANALLVNFQLGIDGDGLPFARYNGNSMPYLFTEAKASHTHRLQPDQWYHLAATFDGPGSLDEATNEGTWIGSFKLYVNGRLAASVPSAEIPANGVIGGVGRDPNNPQPDHWLQTATVVPMALVVGASDAQPDAMIHGGAILVGPDDVMLYAPGDPAPALFDHFRGHVDELRVWNRGIAQETIVERMRDTFRRAEVTRLEDEEELRYYFTFDNLPDPDNIVAPVGFDSVMGRPFGYYSSPWWGTSGAGIRSEWYDDYRWIPWIENLVAHRPQPLPPNANHPAYEIVTNTVVIGEETVYETSRKQLYPNNSNPYGFIYNTATRFANENHPFMQTGLAFGQAGADGIWAGNSLLPDLLPLGFARTDESVPLWDNDTPGSADFDSDGDGIPDWWEIAHGLDPFDPTDAFRDNDLDGLSNLQEYLAGTDPNKWDTHGSGNSDFFQIDPETGMMLGFLYSDNDFVEDHWEARYDDYYASPFRYDEHLDRDGDGWDNWSEARWHYHTASDSRPDQAFTEITAGERPERLFPTPDLKVTVDYLGMKDLGPLPMPLEVRLVVHAYRDKFMNGLPDAVYSLVLSRPINWPIQATLTTRDLTYGHLKQGVNYFYAFLDMDQSKDNNILDHEIDPRLYSDYAYYTWTPGEPAGMAEGSDKGIEIGWDLNELFFGLTDEAPAYARVRWAGSPYANSSSNLVQIIGADGVPAFSRVLRGSRTWLHEGDIAAGLAQNYGLRWGQAASPRHIFKLRLNSLPASDMIFTNIYPSVMAIPQIDYPKDGGIVYNARPDFEFRLDPFATEFDFELRRGTPSGSVVYAGRHQAPPRRRHGLAYENDKVIWKFPYSAGTVLPNGQLFSNDDYYWRVKAYGPAHTAGTSWSTPAHFEYVVTVNNASVTQTGWLNVDVCYPSGIATTNGAPIWVQAFRSRSFNGTPDGELQIYEPGVVTFAGLEKSTTYYVRAYVDQNGNRKRDQWESYGYVRQIGSVEHPFSPEGITSISSLHSVPPMGTVTIIDVDTDNDKIPDALEYHLFGTTGPDWLSKAGPQGIPPYTGFRDGLYGLAVNYAEFGRSLLMGYDDGLVTGSLQRRLLGSDDGELRLSITRFDKAAGRLGWDWSVTYPYIGTMSVSDTDVGNTMRSSVKLLVEFTEKLDHPDWQPVEQIVTSQSDGSLDLPVRETPSGFYRIRILQD